jgi:hypothetical protein
MEFSDTGTTFAHNIINRSQDNEMISEKLYRTTYIEGDIHYNNSERIPATK